MEILINQLTEEENFKRLMQFISESEQAIGSCNSGGGGGGGSGGGGDCGSCQTG